MTRSFNHVFNTLWTGTGHALHAVGSNVPVYIAAILVVLIGVVVGYVVSWVVVMILRSIKLDQVSATVGWDKVFMGKTNVVDLVGDLIRWFFIVVALVEALVALGVPQVDGLVREVLHYLPNVFAAAVVLGIGGLFANLASRIVEVVAQTISSTYAALLGTVSRVAVWVVIVLLALGQLQLSQTYINDLFYGVVIALILAFGLGGRDAAAGLIARLSKSAK